MAERRISLERMEVLLAIIVLLLSLGFVFEVPRSAEGLPPMLIGPLSLMWEILILITPGILALTVFLDVMAHGYRLITRYISTRTQSRPGDTALRRVLVSVGLGILAAYTIWWVIGSFYVMYIASVGGIPPSIVALLFGGILAVFVLIKVIFFELFPTGPVARIRELRARGK